MSRPSALLGALLRALLNSEVGFYHKCSPKYSKGIHILETFDNGDQTIDYDGYNLIFDNKGDFPLFDLQGILLRPGELSILKITPTLFGITGTARKRFDYLERKCVSEEDGITFNITQFDITQYSESNCFMAAALEQTYKKCLNNNTKTSYLKCFIDDMEQIGRWKFDEVNVNIINKSDVLKKFCCRKVKSNVYQAVSGLLEVRKAFMLLCFF